MATTSTGAVKTGFGNFGKNVVSSNKTNAAKQSSTPAFSGAVSSAFKTGATSLTNKGSGGAQAKAKTAENTSSSSVKQAPTGSLSSSVSTITSPKAFSFNTPTISSPTIGVAEAKSFQDAIQLPVAPDIKSNLTGDLIATNAALGINADGTVKNAEAPTDVTTTATTPITTPEDYLKAAGIPIPKQQESLADAYLKAERQYGIQKKQQEVNNLSAQLGAIVAKSQADQLSVTGQGRGIPEAIIGGQQAQIAKEAAIQALPVQAQLAAAQGNLEMAQERLDTYYKVVSQDIENKYNYDMKLYDTVYDYATKQQQIKIDELRDEKNFQRQKELAALNFSYDKQIKQLGIAQEGAVALTAAQKTKQDAITNVLGQLDNYRNLVNQYTGIGGSKLFGEKAAELRTAKSALEFSIASAVGTGALQAADREVVRDLLPDPTSISGSAGIIARGGKSGALKAIDQARGIFSGSLGTIGSGGQQTTVTRPEDLRSKYNY